MTIRRLPPFLGLAALWACAPPDPPQRTRQNVTVAVTCSGNDVTFAVSPWYLELSEGDEVSWQLTQGQTITIEPERGLFGARWPFQDNKYAGGPGDNPTASRMKGGQAGKSYRYVIAVTCTVGDSTRTVKLDPDVYIKRN